MKHTQGKWEINPVETFYESIGIITHEENKKGFIFNEIDKVYFNDKAKKEETKANAKLIAAAPDLLADAISDVECIEDFVRRFKNEETDKVVYFLENLLVSKKAVINKALK